MQGEDLWVKQERLYGGSYLFNDGGLRQFGGVRLGLSIEGLCHRPLIVRVPVHTVSTVTEGVLRGDHYHRRHFYCGHRHTPPDHDRLPLTTTTTTTLIQGVKDFFINPLFLLQHHKRNPILISSSQTI